MAFDKSLPTNTTKIRNYPTVLTDNFAGIQTGDLTFKVWQLNLADRDLVAGAPPPTQDPTRDDDTMMLFAKQDASGETELFVLDDRSPANNFQITENGRIGSSSTNISLDTLTFDSGTTNYDENYIINAHGRFAGTGATVYVKQCTVSRISQGVYRVTFTTPRANINYSVTANCINEGNSRVCKIGNYAVGSFRIYVVSQNGDASDIGAQFQVVGGF